MIDNERDNDNDKDVENDNDTADTDNDNGNCNEIVVDIFENAIVLIGACWNLS